MHSKINNLGIKTIEDIRKSFPNKKKFLDEIEKLECKFLDFATDDEIYLPELNNDTNQTELNDLYYRTWNLLNVIQEIYDELCSSFDFENALQEGSLI